MTTWQENDLHAAQLELEKESTSLGIARYEKIREQRQEAETGPGRKLVMESIDATAAAIMAFVAEADTGKPGKRHAALKFIRHLNPHALAYLTSFTCVNALVADHRKAVSVAITLGHEVANEINFSLLREKHPGLYRVVQEQLKKSTSARHSTAVMRHVIADAEFAPEDDKRLYLSDKDALLVGMKLIELFVEATGLVELVTVAERGKRHLLIAGNQKVLDWLTKAHDSAALYQPVLMPMVVPPRPWTTPRDGGYLTDIGGRADLVRTRNRAYKRELALVDMPNVYQALNAIQATAWKVNVPVLEVMRELWNAGGGVAGLPERELMDLPSRPALLETDPDYFKEHHADEFKEWKRDRAKVYEANARSVSTRLAAAQKIALAEKFAEYPAIYFPHNLDFRGRCYPLPPTLTPQGDDALSANPQTGSDFIVTADRFAFVHPQYTSGGTLASIKYPFVIGTVGGQSTVGIQGALVVDGTITADKIRVNSLAALTANAGTINGGTFKTHTLDGNGNIVNAAEFRVEISNLGDWPLWVGSGAKNANNAVFYVDRNGGAFFRGRVNAPNIVGQFQSATGVWWTGATSLCYQAGNNFIPLGDWVAIHEFWLGAPVLAGEGHTPSVSVTVTANTRVYGLHVILEELRDSVWVVIASHEPPMYRALIQQMGGDGNTFTASNFYTYEQSVTLSASGAWTGGARAFRVRCRASSPPPQVHGYDAPAYPNYLITSIGGFAFGIR
ncbi:TPA: hypothetical protein UL927_000606 [Stenotrophomonas maltophilia]|uniref:phage tail tip fiber protein n=1 Tax=Stenotrophomonas maltophilia TaxID=40324 RepID=UPI001FA6B827|nr:hypothetical protein [Stenotrophomonas maltophilia]HEL7667254.1 hypothetical protein [Stenotrophomonas maltophilia]